MAETSLQTAFEIKTMCDELSRRLLRWHWEQQEGRTLRQLADHVARRAEEDPDYFARMQEMTTKTTWQQLDTTFCMRVLLDPGDGADGQPLQLLRAAPRPVLARQSCNGLRLARNAAAHATGLDGAAEAAAAFAEAVEKLDDGYGDAVFTAAELEKYRKAAARAVSLCREAAINGEGESEPPAAKRRGAAAPAAESASAAGSAARRSGSGASTASKSRAASGSGEKPGAAAKSSTARSVGSSSGSGAKSGSSTAASRSSGSRASGASGSRSASGSRASGGAAKRSGSAGTHAARTSSGSAARKSTSGARKTTAARTGGKKRAPARKKKRMGGVEWVFLAVGVVVLAAALWLRGKSLGLFG